MLRKIVIGAAVVVTTFVGVVATRPAHFHVERSAVIEAAPESAYARVEDFRAWTAWSPYEKLDANLQRTYEGRAAGVGAAYAWSGEKAGAGRMTITGAERPSRIDIRLEFVKPFACTNTASFTFVPTGAGTKVTWSMDGENGFLAKAASLFFDMDKLVGGDFERGLAALKVEAEKDTKVKAEAASGTR